MKLLWFSSLRSYPKSCPGLPIHFPQPSRFSPCPRNHYVPQVDVGCSSQPASMSGLGIFQRAVASRPCAYFALLLYRAEQYGICKAIQFAHRLFFKPHLTHSCVYPESASLPVIQITGYHLGTIIAEFNRVIASKSGQANDQDLFLCLFTRVVAQ